MKRSKSYRKLTKVDWPYIIARHNNKSHAWGEAEYNGQLLALCGRLLPQYSKDHPKDEIECNDCARYLFNHGLL